MPFLKLQPETVIRLNDNSTEAASPRHLNSLSCRLVNFPFQDEYDVWWQEHLVRTDSGRGASYKWFDPKYRVLTADIYDHDTLPFGTEIADEIFERLADWKRKFFPSYTNTEPFDLNPEQVIDDTDFLDHVFNAFYRQSFYRYAQFQMFKSTTELNTKPGFFLRRGLWGYFTSDALHTRYEQDLGEGAMLPYRNSAKSSAYVWDDKDDYIGWLKSNDALTAFVKCPDWVGLATSADYTGWLREACDAFNNNAVESLPDIYEYYHDKIQLARKEPISVSRIIMAEVVNDLYKNLTQINRHISKELSLLFDTLEDSPDQPPQELLDDGYITITFSLSNCFGNISEKLGTTVRKGSRLSSFYPFRTSDPSIGWQNHNYVLTCEYGQTYDILDYERLLTVGREDNQSIPLIRSYNGSGTPTWCLATNPYDVFILDLNSEANRKSSPSTEAKNNGRAGMVSGKNLSHLSSDGLWLNAVCLATQTSAIADLTSLAYCPLSAINGQTSGPDRIATAYAHWSESTYYNTGRYPMSNIPGHESEPKFEIHTVSNIRSEPYSSYSIFNSRNPAFLSVSSNSPADQNIYPRTTCKQYFTHYMKTKIRAVWNKTYLPVFDQSVTEQMLKFREDPIEMQFDNANIRALRTGIQKDTGYLGPENNGGCHNEDPYYMKYRRYYEGDSEKEKNDQHGGGTPPGSSYSGSSRPIWASAQGGDGDYEWNKVYEALCNPAIEWRGNTFHFKINQRYLNPRGEWFSLGIIADVKDIGFLLKTDIKMNSGYEVRSKAKARFYERFHDDEGYSPPAWYNIHNLAILDPYNNPLNIFKAKNESLRLTDDSYKIPIVRNNSYSSIDVLDPFRLANSAFVGKFKSAELNTAWTRQNATNAWIKLTNFLEEVFPGCTDKTIYGSEGVRQNQTYVIWIKHYTTVPKSQSDHWLDYKSRSGEWFFLALRGFAFGLSYRDTEWS